MQKRRLGETDLELPIISFGASSLGHAFGPVRMEQGLESVHVSLDLGISHFDTSPFYGRGISEVLLGIALRDIPRERFTVSTKVGRYDDDKFDFRPERVTESIDTSLFRLGVDYLDIVFLHDVEFTDYKQSINDALPALLREKDKGKVRYVGIAGYPFKPLRYTLENYDIDVTLNYNHYTLQNRRLVSELLPVLEDCGVGVINAAPFAQRLLTHMQLPEWHPADAELRQACREAVLYCRAMEINPAKLCIQFSTRHPRLTTCVIGTGNPKNVRDWVAWLDEPYEEAALHEIGEILRPVMDRNAVFGRPENNDDIEAAVGIGFDHAPRDGVLRRAKAMNPLRGSK